MAFLQQPAAQPFLRAPAVVLWLIAALLGIYAVQTSFGDAWPRVFFPYEFLPARYLPAHLTLTGIFALALPFFSYTFLHGSWPHVLLNSVWLLAFGPVVARRFGTPLFLVFFLVCSIAAAATHLAIYWGSTEPVVGASGAISGLMAASFRMLPFDSRHPPLAPLLSPRILAWTAIWAVVNVIAGVTGLGAGGGPAAVAWVAHLGGYGAGLLLAGPFDRLGARSGLAEP